jgi:hypothetical protein
MIDEPDKVVGLILRLPESLRREAKVAVAEEGTTLQVVLLALLEEWLAKRKAA